MTEITSYEEDGRFEVIPLHFDVANHHIPLNDFIDTAKNTEAIIEGFNKRLFRGELKYELMVGTPENGGLVEILQYIGQGIGLIWVYSETASGKEFFKNLTGHEPAYWHGLVGKKLKAVGARKKDQEFLKNDDQKNLLAKEAQDAKMVEVVVKEPSEKEIIQFTEALLMSKAIVSILKTETDKLSRHGITPRNYREAFEARNRFFAICSANKNIKGLGFDKKHRFPIKRADFAKLLVNIPPEEKPQEEPDWIVSSERILIPAPVLEEDLQDTHKWVGRLSNGKRIHFIIEDKSFWKLCLNGEISFRAGDQLEVQWAFEVKNGRRFNVRVLRVIGINQKLLVEPFSEDVLASLLGDYTIDNDPQRNWLDEL